MGTSALSSEMAMGWRPIAKSGLFSLVPIEEVHLQGGTFLGGEGALFRSPLWFIGMWVLRPMSKPGGAIPDRYTLSVAFGCVLVMPVAGLAQSLDL
jgi:hypothetical protein